MPKPDINRLIKAFDHHEMRAHRINEWWGFFLQDILAGFGRKLERPWNELQQKHLFRIGGIYADLVIENEPFTDILGQAYEALASNHGKRSFGQFFTPSSVSDMMAKMTFDMGIFDRKEGQIFVHEPCSGAGIMLLSILKLVYNEDKEKLTRLTLHANDLDWQCCAMTAIQITSSLYIHQISLGQAFITRGNTLDDLNKLTPYFHLCRPDVEPLSIAKIAGALMNTTKSVTEENKIGGQLTLL